MTFLPILTLMASYQGVNTPVTVSIRATPVQRAVAALSALSKVKLEVTPTMTPDIVVVSVQDVPLSMVMQQMAKVCSAEWTEAKGVWRLGPAVGLRNREALASETRRRKDLKRTIEAQLKRVVSNHESASPEVPPVAFLTQTDLNRIVALPYGSRLVYSTRPNSLQLAFSGDLTSLVSETIRSHNELATTLAQTPDEELGQEPGPLTDERRNQLATKSQLEKPITSVAFTTLEVHWAEPTLFTRPTLQLTLSLYDSAGKALHRSAQILETSQPERTLETPPPTESNALIKWSEETERFLTYVQGAPSDLKTESTFNDPVASEPLSFSVTDALLASATERKAGLIACVGDEVALLPSLLGGNVTTAIFETALGLLEGGQMRLKDGLLTVQPVDPAATRAARLDRTGLSLLSKAVANDGYVSLTTLAGYLSKRGVGPISPLERVYLSRFPGTAGLPRSNLEGMFLICLYAALTPDQQRALSNGERVDFQTLTPQASTWLQRFTYGHFSEFSFDPKTPEAVVATPWPDFRAEPTLLLPDGLPRDGWIEAHVTSEPAALRNEQERRDILTIADVKQLRADGVAMNKLYVGTRRTFQLRLMFRPGVLKVGEMYDYQFDSSRKAVSYDQLPAVFRTP